MKTSKELPHLILRTLEAKAKLLQGGKSLKIWNASRICVSSLRRGHANLLCIVPILVYVLPKQARPTLFLHRI